MSIDVRKVTNKVYEAVDDGSLDWEAVGSAALQFMSEDDVATMAHDNEWFFNDDEDES